MIDLKNQFKSKILNRLRRHLSKRKNPRLRMLRNQQLSLLLQHQHQLRRVEKLKSLSRNHPVRSKKMKKTTLKKNRKRTIQRKYQLNQKSLLLSWMYLKNLIRARIVKTMKKMIRMAQKRVRRMKNDCFDYC